MARTKYGGSTADVVMKVDTDGDYAPETTIFHAYNAETGGTRLTGLLDADGGDTDVVTMFDHLGVKRIQFQGPDTGYAAAIWLLDTNNPGLPRYRVEPADLSTRVSATDHGGLTGLGDDDHTQYHNNTRGDVRYYTKAQVDALALGGGVTDHGALDGLADDDHTQYHTDARGDARYYEKSVADLRYVLNPAVKPAGALMTWNGSSWVALLPGTSDLDPPTQVNNFVATAITQTTASFSWDASTDNVAVTGYKVYKVQDNVGGGGGQVVELVGSPPASQRTFSISGLTPNTDYEFRCTAVDLVGNESPVASYNVHTPSIIDTTAPTIPTGLFAAVIGTESIELDWNPSTDSQSGLAGYNVYQGPSPGTVDLTTPINTGGLVTQESFLVTGLTDNTGYRFRVAAVDLAGNESTPGAAYIVTTLDATDVTPPSQVTGLATSAVQPTGLTLTWNAATDDSGIIGKYNIYRALGSGGGGGGGATPFRTHNHEGTVGTTPTGPAENYDSRTGTAMAYVGTAHDGSQSFRFDGTALTYFDDTAVGSGTLVYKMPVRFEAMTASSKFSLARNGTTALASVERFTDGKLRILDGGNTLRATGNTVLANNTWYIVEVKYINGSCTVRLYDSAGTTKLDSDLTTSAVTAGVPNAHRLGLRAVGVATLIDKTEAAADWITTDPTAGGATTKIGEVAGSKLTYAAVGLSASTQYTFQVAAEDPSGNVGTKSTGVTVTTSAPSGKQIIYGLNAAYGDVGQRLGDRTAARGWQLSPTDTTSWVDPDGTARGVGMSRCYYGNGLPAGGFSASYTAGGFGVNFNKRCNVTFKGATPEQVLAGDLDVVFCHYVNTIPVDWEIALTYWHEPADNLNTGNFTADKYRRAHIRFGALLENRTPAGTAKRAGAETVSLAAGTNVYTAPCITVRGLSSTPEGGVIGKWSTGVPETSVKNALAQATDLDAKAMILLDSYQNPPPSIAASGPDANAGRVTPPPPYTDAYPAPANVLGYFFAHILNEYEYNVGEHAWGIGEFMAPLRDDDPTGVYQAEAIEAYLDYCEAATPTPRVILFWEHPQGNMFNQTCLNPGRRTFVQHALGPYAI